VVISGNFCPSETEYATDEFLRSTAVQYPISRILTRILLLIVLLLPVSLSVLAQNGREPNDIRPGSVLFFNRFTSNSLMPAVEDTQINITNTNQSQGVELHLFFVDGNSCSISDSSMYLTASQTAAFNVSDYDPDTKGYLVVVATSGGLPTQFNHLLGSAYIREQTGAVYDLPAVTVQKISTGEITLGDDFTAEMKFDGDQYEKLPGIVAISSFNSQVTDTTTLHIYTPLTSFIEGGSGGVSVFCLMYNDAEISRSLSFRIGGCYRTVTLRELGVLSGINNFIPARRTGWLRMTGSGKALMGASYNRGQIFTGGRNLSNIQLVSHKIKIPVF
jgi:hypothetical protein